MKAPGIPHSLLLVGGTSAIGLAIVDAYLSAGARRVVLMGRPSERLDAAAQRLRATGAGVEVVPFDVRDPATHADAVIKAFAGGHVDLAVVALGKIGDQQAAWTDAAVAVENAEVNYVAPVSLGVLLADRLRAQGHGVLVALSSVVAERSPRSVFVYGSAKAGMDAFYLGLGEALRGSGARVLVVRPGFVHTALTAALRPTPLAVRPPVVAEAVLAAVRTGSDLIWVPSTMRVIMAVMRHLPRAVFRRLPM